MNTEPIIQVIYRAIQNIVAINLNKVSVSWEEVEDLYASGKYPEINAEIDYILGDKN